MKIELGQIFTGETLRRDAIHIAVAPVLAGEELAPGDSVRFHPNKTRTVVKCSMETRIGIVDPFLKVNVDEGEQFWLLVNPGTYTNLRHEWDHPGFNSKEAIEERDFDGNLDDQWDCQGCND